MRYGQAVAFIFAGYYERTGRVVSFAQNHVTGKRTVGVYVEGEGEWDVPESEIYSPGLSIG